MARRSFPARRQWPRRCGAPRRQDPWPGLSPTSPGDLELDPPRVVRHLIGQPGGMIVNPEIGDFWPLLEDGRGVVRTRSCQLIRQRRALRAIELCHRISPRLHLEAYTT